MPIIANSAVVITRFANALYGFQLGKLTYDAVQADVGRLGLDATLNGYFAGSFGDKTTASVTANLLKTLGIVAGANGLTADNVAAASGFILGKLNAEPAGNRGKIVKDILDMWANIGDDAGLGATYGAAASAWNAQVSNGMEYTAGHAADAPVNNNAVQGTFTLTNGSDTATANIFNSTVVYNPAGTDRINALQSEDVLTGTGTNPTLNATMGNANDNGGVTVTPTLKGIESINLSVTGNTSTLDARFADSLKTLSINKVTAEAANGAKVTNINQPAANLTVKDSANVDNDIAFEYSNGVLVGNADSGTLTLSNVQANPLTVSNATATEGFETLTVNASNTNVIKSLEATDLENLVIKGSGTLSFLNTNKEIDRVEFVGGGLDIGDGTGIRSIDASAFTGALNLDITAATGAKSDPSNSGSKYFASVTGGKGNDTFWTSDKLDAASATNRNTLDGGEGTNKLVTIDAGVDKSGGFLPSVKNIQSLDLRLQGGAATTAYLSAFDAALTSVTARNEQLTGTVAAASAGTFNLREVGTNVGAINLLHASGNNTATDTVNVALTTSTGTSDTVVVNVKSDLNFSTTYNYNIGLETEAALATGAGAESTADKANRVENLTINDMDSEANKVGISGNDATAASLTGTLTLTGGTAGKGYTVSSTLLAGTIDAAAQKSNLVLTVGAADQAIKLGTGDDLLTFDGVDTFNGSDTITDAGGTDTVRAAFSQAVTGQPGLAGIEKLQIVATANTRIDMTKAAEVTQLAILSDKAVDEAGEVFTAALAGVATTDVITLANTKLTEINFFGDEDAAVAGTTFATAQTFNGLTLENNTGDAVAVKISAPLTNKTGLAGNGITTNTLGQLTTHGVKDLSVAVSNEKDKATTTTITNIWDRDLVNLTLSATGNVDVGTVTGNSVNSNIKSVTATAVGGNTTAVVKALGDSAVVTLGAGNDSFNALGSAGNNVVIRAGEGNNTVTGTAQSDYIYSGAGRDVISAGRGNNTINTGAGSDTVDALNGSNTVDVGSGTKDSVTFKYDTDAQRDLATNVVAGNGTNATILIDAAADVKFGFAVGAGADASVKFTGATFDAIASTLNGRSAVVLGAPVPGVFTGVEPAQSNLLVATDAGGVIPGVVGGSAADVFLDYTTGVGAAYSVSLADGNDGIVISQTSTAAHVITGGAGADRIVLSAVGGIDTLVYAAGESTAASRDVVTNFAAADIIDVSTRPLAVGLQAGLTSLAFKGVAADITVAAGYVTSAAAGATLAAADVDAMLAYLHANIITDNDIYMFNVEMDGAAGFTAGDSTLVVQKSSAAAGDTVIELVGAAGLANLTMANFL